jgi:hypothetical protein
MGDLMDHNDPVAWMSIPVSEFEELSEKAQAYTRILEAAANDSLASDGLEMIYASMREDNE